MDAVLTVLVVLFFGGLWALVLIDWLCRLAHLVMPHHRFVDPTVVEHWLHRADVVVIDTLVADLTRMLKLMEREHE